MQRRNFIKNSILATGALSLPLSGNKAFAGSPVFPLATNNFKKSIMWGTIGVQGSILDKCKAVKETGFEGIEANSHMNRKELIDATKSTGLTITDVCCSTHWSKPLTHPDAAVRQEGLDGVTVALEDAHAYGTDAILLVPGVVNEAVPYDECWKRSVEAIKKLLPVAKKLKVMICIENVGNYFLMSPMEACNYVDQFKSPYVKFYFDIGNIMSSYSWPEHWINILGDRIARIHIKEFSRQVDDQGRRVRALLADGDVKWPKVMEAVRKNYKHVWLTTEQGSNRTLEELKDLSQRFDRILNT